MIQHQLEKLKQAIVNSQNHGQVVRFLIAGVVIVGTDYGTFLLAQILIANLLLSSAASLAAGFIVSFTLNRLWVFGADKKHAQKNSLLQLTLYSMLFIFNVAFTYYFISLLELHNIKPAIGKIIAICFITVWNFAIYKKIIFKVK